MSIATDLATIRILGTLHQSIASPPLSQTVETLCREVEYINWAGVYFYEGEDTLLAAYAGTDSEDDVMQSRLAFPIHKPDGTETGVLVVKSRQWIVFDVNDVPTLETVAAEIGKTKA
ncbi:hypothetical protein [Salibacterium halotolerans]|uniref:GAF domain-containing protein n=1 Tax=Salibacterium halotolerans TaxID=1884432 RepID=A0A1I5RHW2_9BACI|nr:hypothetical protein [Salibacterium halotolerans]SFP57536.1 hypothetical protein SAMN05518683_10734 [Salibacterium halotolerans]